MTRKQQAIEFCTQGVDTMAYGPQDPSTELSELPSLDLSFFDTYYDVQLWMDVRYGH